MVGHFAMRSEIEEGALLIPITYKTYDEKSRANRTPWTIFLSHKVRMEKPNDRLVRARLRAGLKTPTEAARKFSREINRNTITSHENGNRPISRKAAERYGRLFDVEPGWLLFGGDEPLGLPEVKAQEWKEPLREAAMKALQDGADGLEVIRWTTEQVAQASSGKAHERSSPDPDEIVSARILKVISSLLDEGIPDIQPEPQSQAGAASENQKDQRQP